jgi:GTP-binding protein HflX
MDDHMAAVEALLKELDVIDRPTVLALNKVDRLERGAGLEALAARRAGVPISAATGEGIPALLAAIDAALPVGEPVTLRIPHSDGTALALCYERGRVLTRADEADHVRLQLELPHDVMAGLAPYRV